MLGVPPDDFKAETDELLERLELLLLAGCRRLPPRSHEGRLLQRVIEHSGRPNLEPPERVVVAHELVLDLQDLVLPHGADPEPSCESGESITAVLG